MSSVVVSSYASNSIPNIVATGVSTFVNVLSFATNLVQTITTFQASDTYSDTKQTLFGSTVYDTSIFNVEAIFVMPNTSFFVPNIYKAGLGVSSALSIGGLLLSSPVTALVGVVLLATVAVSLYEVNR